MSGTARERTELGWRRTGLAAAALTGVFVRSHVDRLDALGVTVIALSAAVVLVVLVVSYLRPAITDGRVPAAVAALTGVIAAAQLATIVFT